MTLARTIPTLTGTIDREVELAFVRATAAQNSGLRVRHQRRRRLRQRPLAHRRTGGRLLYQGPSADGMIPVEIDFERAHRAREFVLRGLGQQLESFRDRKVEFADVGFAVYAAEGRQWPYLNQLGPLVKPDRSSRVGLQHPPYAA